MSSQDNKPASLEAILRSFLASHVKYPENIEASDLDEAIAAISALIPEKQRFGDEPITSIELARQAGFNSAIDQIHKNFNGEANHG